MLQELGGDGGGSQLLAERHHDQGDADADPHDQERRHDVGRLYGGGAEPIRSWRKQHQEERHTEQVGGFDNGHLARQHERKRA